MISGLIVDDEPFARDNLRLLLKDYCPMVSHVYEARNAEEALQLIQNHQPNITFLDIQMPGKNGIDFAAEIQSINTSIVFVTAYDQFALKAFKLSAIDYLLKPVEPKELIQAVNKCMENKKNKMFREQLQIFQSIVAKQEERIALPSANGLDFYELKNIIFFKADESYCEVWLSGNTKRIISRKLGEIESLLDEAGFVRVHKSFMININHIVRYIRGEGGQVLLTNGAVIDVSRRKKDELLQKIQRL
jgi:two-component system LytT family response regulator